MFKKYITFLLLTSITIAQAQWQNDTAINTLAMSSIIDDMQAIGTTEGETYIVSWKAVSAPVNYELRLQILDADGNLKLGEDGMLISDQIPMSTFTVIWKIVVDANDHLYVSVTGTGGDDPAYVFKIDNEGNALWDPAGVNVGNGNLVTVLPMSNGDAIVSWLSATGTVMQRYNATGTPLWATTQPITTGSGTAAPLNFHEISGGDFVAVFHQLIGGINSNLYAQRYNANGAPVWVTATQLSNKQTRFNSLYSGGQIGDAVYIATSSPNGNRFDAYLQRINENGNLPWGINGVDFDTNATVNEGDVSMQIDENSLFIYAASNYADATQNMTGLYVQKFDATTGDRLFTETAKQVFAIGEQKVLAGSLQLLAGTPWFLTKSGTDNGASPTTLGVTYLDEDGAFVFNEQTRPVATFMANKGRIHFTAPANGQSVAVFVENKGDGSKVYAQNTIEEILNTTAVENAVQASYTNPVTSVLTVSSNSIIKTVAIYNLQGSLIKQQQNNNEQIVQIPTSELAAGIYLLRVAFSNETTTTYKFLKN